MKDIEFTRYIVDFIRYFGGTKQALKAVQDSTHRTSCERLRSCLENQFALTHISQDRLNSLFFLRYTLGTQL